MLTGSRLAVGRRDVDGAVIIGGPAGTEKNDPSVGQGNRLTPARFGDKSFSAVQATGVSLARLIK
jgi:hypothetical protein